ncbi:MAG: hypothetical protein WBL20_15970 [Sphingobium sp.]
MRRGVSLLLKTLQSNFPTADEHVDDAIDTWRLRQSYLDAIETLKAAGIAVQTDGIEPYVAARRAWEPAIQRVAPVLGYTITEIDSRRTEDRERLQKGPIGPRD